MQIKGVIVAILGIAALSDAAAFNRRTPFTRTLNRRQFGGGGGKFGGNQGQNQGQNGNQGQNQGQDQADGANNNAGGDATLDANAVQTGSQQDGNQQPADGQSASAT